jgi:predicted Zn-dependent peptidase
MTLPLKKLVRRLPVRLLLSASLLAAAGPAAAGPEPPAGQAPAEDPAIEAMKRLRLSIQRATLENGLRVVMNLDASSPTVAVAVTYDVGSRDESPGQGGFAHLFEHMMFQGSRNVDKGEHFTLIAARGGTLNGTTSEARTNYYASLPSNELALGLWLEADRMKWLAVTEENFENQRAVVMEEYRMRVENAAYRRGLLRLNELIYEGYYPLSHPAIGSMEDLEAAKFEWVKAFHERHYRPGNAVLSISGDFDPDNAMALVREYFGGAEAGPARPPRPPPAIPEQKAERREAMQDRHAKTPGLLMGWRIADTRTPEHYALELATMVLAHGESSRLHQLLVRDKALARTVSAWTDDTPGPDSLTLIALLTEKARLSEVEQLIGRELESLAAKGPKPEELEKAKNQLRTQVVFGMQSNLERATRLGEFEVYYGDARLLTRELDGYLAVKPEDVQRAVAQYLTAQRRSVVEVLPGAEESGR